MELSALTRKTGPVPNQAMARPARAGPTMRAELKVAADRASAFGSSRVSTISETNACRTGVSIALTTPSRPAKTKTCQSRTTPDMIINARTRESTLHAALTTMSSLRLSYRSASLPPYSERNSTGRNCNATTVPSAVPESCDSCRTSQYWAVNCIQTPISLTS